MLKMNIRVDKNICRVCLKASGARLSALNSELIDKFKYATQLEITKTDGLPLFFCNQCTARLKIAFEFRRLSIESDGQMRAFINKVNNDFKKVATAKKTIQELQEDELNILIEAGYKPQAETVTIIAANKIETEPLIDEGTFNGEYININLNDPDPIFFQDNFDDKNEAEVSETESLTKVENVKNENDFFTYKEKSDIQKDPIHVYRLVCNKCPKVFSTKTNLVRHMHTHNEVKPFLCKICSKTFTQKGSLDRHMLLHTGEKPFKCKICGRTFTQSKTLTFHMRVHTGEKPFSCKICNWQFLKLDGLKRHNETKHMSDGNFPGIQMYQCSICNKRIKSKISFDEHLQKHSQEQEQGHEFSCKDCGKTFQTPKRLETHRLQHTKAFPYKCNQCDKAYARKHTLQAHIVTHLDQKPFQCPICPKGFTMKHRMKAHLERHKLSFNCGLCSKNFETKAQVVNHMANCHPTEELIYYKCSHCSFVLTTQAALELHIMTKHHNTDSFK